jgi:hypothetical protein
MTIYPVLVLLDRPSASKASSSTGVSSGSYTPSTRTAGGPVPARRPGQSAVPLRRQRPGYTGPTAGDDARQHGRRPANSHALHSLYTTCPGVSEFGQRP